MAERPEPNLVKARAAASRLLRKYSITHPKDISLEDVAMAEGALVREAPIKGAEAWLIRQGDKGIIQVRNDIPEFGRKRFAIAHEIGHWECHSNLTQIFFCLEEDFQDYSKSIDEIEANTFASYFLLPPFMFRPHCDAVAEPNLEAIRDLSETFGTTLTATSIRFAEECEEDCFVVFSVDGIIKWWKKKDRGLNLWVDNRRKISSSSAAWDCLNGRNSNRMQEVPFEAWFKESRYSSQFTVYEQSIKLGQYPTILTLLWIVDSEDSDSIY